MKLIDPNELYRKAEKTYGRLHVADVDAAIRFEVMPVIHAKWLDTTPMWLTGGQTLPTARLQCSNCGRRTGYRQSRTYKYCPKCGARMDEEAK